MSEQQCLGLLAFSSLSQSTNQNIIELGKSIKNLKKGCRHPFRFKLIKQSSTDTVEATWEFYGIRRCINPVSDTARICRQCMTRNGKNEEFYSKNHGRVDAIFENRTSKLYGSPIYLELIKKGWTVDTKEEYFCRMLQEEAFHGLKLFRQELADDQVMAPKRFRNNTPQLKSLLIDDTFKKPEILPHSQPVIFPAPLMIQTGTRKLSVKKINHITPTFEIIDGVKYYLHTNGTHIAISEIFVESIKKYPTKVVESINRNDQNAEDSSYKE
jgi:hypothetical protein